MMIKNIQLAERKMKKFNIAGRGCQLCDDSSYFASKILKVGINISARGTESVSQTKQRIKWLNQAIKLAEEINSSKLRKDEW